MSVNVRGTVEDNEMGNVQPGSLHLTQEAAGRQIPPQPSSPKQNSVFFCFVLIFF